MALVELLGSSVQGKNGEVETASFCGEGRYVALYFSAHWCPPCRGFTPKLADFYEKFSKKSAGKLEIVFVSSDRNQGDCDGYYIDMPWLVLPFSKRDIKGTLSTKFGVSGIPTLIILDSTTGAVVCAQGRNAVMADPEGEEFPWKQ